MEEEKIIEELVKEETQAEEKAAEEMKASTEAKRRMKAERREAKAARKEANKAEEKKKRPNNSVLAILIFGVVIGMFVFVGAYNYFSKPATIEKYMEESGIADVYKDIAVSEYTTMTMTADGNTVNIEMNVAEDAPEDELESYKGEEGDKTIRQWAAYFLTSLKPQTQGFGGTAKLEVKQGDETINSVDISYREAKKIKKEAQKEAEEEADDADADAEDEEESDGE